MIWHSLHNTPRRLVPKLVRRARWSAIVALALLISAAGCAAPASTTQTTGVIQVVAGENFWGSIASQLGGTRVSVTSIINDPNVDPHQFESSTAAARAFAHANYVILNGAGYDSWGQKLLDANPVNGRKVLNVADLLGKKQGDNPHFWYNPDYVQEVIDQITKDYQSLDPGDAQYFGEQQTTFESDLSQYHELMNSIKQTFAGVKVGSTESIFVYMANSLGLDLISPPAFMQAVSEGNDPPAASVAQFIQQINAKQISMLVYNTQTITTITTNMEHEASAEGIPIAGISETIDPATASFQDWQVAELKAIQTALESSRK